MEPFRYRGAIHELGTDLEPAGAHRARRVKRAGRYAVYAASIVCLALLTPKLAEVFEAGRRIGELDVRWLPVILAAELASFACIWALQRVAGRGTSWFVVITTHLAGNAFNRITPLGGVTGAALQAKMMSDADVPPATATSAMATQSILGSVALCALPLIALPLVAIAGTRLSDDLLTASWIGAGVLIALFAFAAWLVSARAPLGAIGNRIEAMATRVTGRAPTGLGDRLVAERVELRRVLGARWAVVTATSIGRWVFEYLALLAILVAIGAQPDAVLTLYALAVAALINLIPLTPGGLGLVELGLAGTLVAAGIPAPTALLGTLLFRMVSFWLPLPIGASAAYVFRRRYPRSDVPMTSTAPSAALADAS